MLIRFGSIGNRKVNAKDIIRESMKNTGWKIETIRSAGVAKKEDA